MSSKFEESSTLFKSREIAEEIKIWRDYSLEDHDKLFSALRIRLNRIENQRFYREIVRGGAECNRAPPYTLALRAAIVTERSDLHMDPSARFRRRAD